MKKPKQDSLIAELSNILLRIGFKANPYSRIEVSKVVIDGRKMKLPVMVKYVVNCWEKEVKK